MRNRVFLGWLFLCLAGSAFAEGSEAPSPQKDHALIVCDNGLELFEWQLAYIRAARYSIELTTAFFGGDVAQAILRALDTQLASEPELHVYLLTTMLIAEKEDLHYTEQLRHCYPDRFHVVYTGMVPVLLPDVSAIENHVKLCVVDGYYFSLGGSNLADGQVVEGTVTPPPHPHRTNKMTKGLAAGHRDQDLVGRGKEMADTLRRTFYQLYTLWESYYQTQTLEQDPEAFAENPYYDRPIPELPYIETFESSPEKILLSKQAITFLLSGPHQKKNTITEAYVQLIRQAKKEIAIANVYCFPVEAIMEALCDAVRRGVKITLVTNGLWDDAPKPNQLFGWANRLSYVPLFYGRTYHLWEKPSALGKRPTRTRIYEYAVPDVLVHKKVMLIDDHLFVIGSYNFGFKSHTSDYETIVVIDSPEVNAAAQRVFARDVFFSREVAPRDAVDWYFNPFISYMGALQRRLGNGLM